MRFIKYTIIVSIFGVLGFSQDIVINGDNNNIALIKLTARKDAIVDFSVNKKILWSGVSFLTVQSYYTYPIQLVAAYGIKPEIPEHRLNQTSLQNSNYQDVYKSKYKSTIRFQRLKYSLTVPCIMVALAPIGILAIGDDF